MSYSSWFDKHAAKHKKIVDKLVACGKSKDEIVDYFDFENMVEHENDFCPLYKDNKKCHDMNELNCYLCACPNFRFNDDGIKKIDDKTQFSFCDINSKHGKQGVYGEKIHQDCSGCLIPHAKPFIKKYFDYDWRKIMKECTL